jgi:hypothetical protein
MNDPSQLILPIVFAVVMLGVSATLLHRRR